MALIFPVPPISTFQSHLLALLFATIYVGSLYVSKNARLSFSMGTANSVSQGLPRSKENNERWRDDPDVIRARLAAVTLATIACCTGLLGLLWLLIGDDVNRLETALGTTATRLGFTLPVLSMDSIYPHLITPALFLGPLYARFLNKSLLFQRRWTYREFSARFLSWQGLRNYSLAPLTEEIVFRACVLSVYHLSGASRIRMIFLGPLTFGLAHVHHAWDTYNRYGRTPDALKRALFTTLFQLLYTTLFGIHASFLFLRTGSILPAVSSHVFCNIMGLPD
ncbi:hypothetical protein BD779DRAFT_1563720, partial [Infundibulicybe gibba]